MFKKILIYFLSFLILSGCSINPDMGKQEIGKSFRYINNNNLSELKYNWINIEIDTKQYIKENLNKVYNILNSINVDTENPYVISEENYYGQDYVNVLSIKLYNDLKSNLNSISNVETCIFLSDNIYIKYNFTKEKTNPDIKVLSFYMEDLSIKKNVNIKETFNINNTTLNDILSIFSEILNNTEIISKDENNDTNLLSFIENKNYTYENFKCISEIENFNIIELIPLELQNILNYKYNISEINFNEKLIIKYNIYIDENEEIYVTILNCYISLIDNVNNLELIKFNVIF